MVDASNVTMDMSTEDDSVSMLTSKNYLVSMLDIQTESTVDVTFRGVHGLDWPGSLSLW